MSFLAFAFPILSPALLESGVSEQLCGCFAAGQGQPTTHTSVCTGSVLTGATQLVSVTLLLTFQVHLNVLSSAQTCTCFNS